MTSATEVTEALGLDNRGCRAMQQLVAYRTVDRRGDTEQVKKVRQPFHFSALSSFCQSSTTAGSNTCLYGDRNALLSFRSGPEPTGRFGSAVTWEQYFMFRQCKQNFMSRHWRKNRHSGRKTITSPLPEYAKVRAGTCLWLRRQSVSSPRFLCWKVNEGHERLLSVK